MSDRSDYEWIQLVDGTPFWPLDAHPSEIRVEPIAHALSHLCRFAGHTREFYSVAEHSVYVSLFCEPADALAGLLHDASEAFLVDVPRPVKHSPALAGYRTIERQLEAVIAEAFGLATLTPPSVKVADERMLATEARDLMAKPQRPWGALDAKPLPMRLVRTWTPRVARERFLARFAELTKGAA